VPSNQNRDNFIDKAFTVIAESIVKIMPIAEKEKKAYIYYRDGLAAQNNGDYSEALEYYKESLLLEENKIDRGETLKNQFTQKTKYQNSQTKKQRRQLITLSILAAPYRKQGKF